jgi:hypothetical protein
VQYADDGILYDYSTEPDLHFPPESNIYIHPGKTKIVKKSGRWLCPLKFLGIQFTHGSLLKDKSRMNSSTSVKGGILENATRISKPFTLDYLDVFNERLLLDYRDQKSSKGSTQRRSWTFEK